MRADFSLFSNHFAPTNEQQHQRLSLSLLVILLLALLLGSFHHHEDRAVHQDCAACAVALHQADGTPPIPTFATIIIPVLLPLYITLVLTVPVDRPVPSLRSRAPPRQVPR